MQDRCDAILVEKRDLLARLEQLREAAGAASRNATDLAVLQAINSQIEALTEKHGDLVQEHEDLAKYLTQENR